MCHSKEGEILVDVEEVIQRRKQTEQISRMKTRKLVVERPTLVEVKCIIAKKKNNKPPRVDEIPSEVIKIGRMSNSSNMSHI